VGVDDFVGVGVGVVDFVVACLVVVDGFVDVGIDGFVEEVAVGFFVVGAVVVKVVCSG
jgi:hypothetical protein